MPTLTSAPAAVLPGHRLFPASRRVYLTGSRPDLRVPMREITLTPTRKAGVKVADVAALIDKLRNEAKVIS